MQPTLGRIVLYKLADYDCSDSSKVNGAKAGDVVPAIITKVWNAETGCVNMTVFVDGPAPMWKTSVLPSDAEAGWSWPPRV